jgi:DNA helicase-2/ATP-dependent DNA helicase PcrA
MPDTSAINLIKQCIDDRKSFCFNAGAGSGKTFSLVQTVNYLLREYSQELITNHQKIRYFHDSYKNVEVNPKISDGACRNSSKKDQSGNL